MIRVANIHDVDKIVEMCKRFYHTTEYIKFAPYDEPSIRLLTQFLMEKGVVLVASLRGELVGVAGLILTPYMFNNNIIGAHEVVWWVEPEAQGMGVGKELLLAIEPECKSRGATIVQMVHLSNSPPQAAGLYLKLGFDHSECCFTKVV
jgi:Acetyltransferases